MKAETLLELAAKWERKALPPKTNIAISAECIEWDNDRGRRSAMNECAEDLKALIKLLG